MNNPSNLDYKNKSDSLNEDHSEEKIGVNKKSPFFIGRMLSPEVLSRMSENQLKSSRN